VNEIPSIRKDLPEHTNTLHHWTRIQDRFVAIYVDLLGCPDSTDTESGSIMRLTFVKCRDKGSKLTVDDCIKVCVLCVIADMINLNLERKHKGTSN
jgi:hypothetical protein